MTRRARTAALVLAKIETPSAALAAIALGAAAGAGVTPPANAQTSAPPDCR